MNPRPADYKSAALPAELHQPIQICVVFQRLIYYIAGFADCQELFIKKLKNIKVYKNFEKGIDK